MAQPFEVEKLQSVLVEGLNGPNGADRMYITVGIVRTSPIGHPVNFEGPIEPLLEPGKFRRAIASVSLMSAEFSGEGQMPASVTDVDADWDDESGKVQLRFTTIGGNLLAFQVMTFAVG